VYFNPDSAELTPRAVDLLKEISEALTSTDHKLEIFGHCAIAGTEKGRHQLSVNRAEAVRSILSQELSAKRFTDVRGIGASDPVTYDPERQFLNRRVVIRIDVSP
jgi:outer membrane protein OmpA-like peptidoglycan-associated protein